MLLFVGFGNAAVFDLELNTGVSIDSNVFRTSEHPVRDFFLTFAPALHAKLSSHRTSLILNSIFISERYRNFSEVNFHQITLNGQARYNLSNHLSFEVNSELTNARNIRLKPTISDITTPLSYISTQISPSLKYERSSGMAITMEYSNEFRNYKERSDYGWNTNGVALSLQYPLGHRTTAQLLFRLKHKVFATDISYLSKFTSVEFSRRLSSKFDAKVYVGRENRTYANSNAKIHAFLVDINITGKLFRKIPIALGFRRSLTDSDIYVGQVLIPFGNTFSFSWDLTSKIRLNVEGAIGRNKYLTSKRSDLRFFGSLQLGYKMMDLGTFYLTYEYEQMNSQIKDEEYRQSQVGISFVRRVKFLR